MQEDINRLNERLTKIEKQLGLLIYSAQYVFHKDIHLFDEVNIKLATGTGTKIGTAATQKIGFFNQTPSAQIVMGANLTNSVTAGGSNNVIANITDLTTYSNSASTIRDDLYQLSRSVKIIQDGLRTLGLLS